MPVKKHTSITYSDFEDMDCGICTEAFDFDEINFFPCECGFQVCKFCWDRILNSENPVCPACRKQYSEDPYMAEDIPESLKEKLLKAKAERENEGANNNNAENLRTTRNSTTSQNVQDRQAMAESDRQKLAHVRVLQKDLVFVQGLSQPIAKEEILRKSDYFGKYGKINNVVINVFPNQYYTAYLTFNNSEDALKAIQDQNGSYVNGTLLKCSLGTTKYCSRYLNNQVCTLDNCMYLHETADPEASFTKADMQLGKHTDYEQQLMNDFKNKQMQREAARILRMKQQKENSNVTKNAVSGQTTTTNVPLLSQPSEPSVNPWQIKKQDSVELTPPQNVSYPPIGPPPGVFSSMLISNFTEPNLAANKILDPTPSQAMSLKQQQSQPVPQYLPQPVHQNEPSQLAQSHLYNQNIIHDHPLPSVTSINTSPNQLNNDDQYLAQALASMNANFSFLDRNGAKPTNNYVNSTFNKTEQEISLDKIWDDIMAEGDDFCSYENSKSAKGESIAQRLVDLTAFSSFGI